MSTIPRKILQEEQIRRNRMKELQHNLWEHEVKQLSDKKLRELLDEPQPANQPE